MARQERAAVRTIANSNRRRNASRKRGRGRRRRSPTAAPRTRAGSACRRRADRRHTRTRPTVKGIRRGVACKKPLGAEPLQVTVVICAGGWRASRPTAACAARGAAPSKTVAAAAALRRSSGRARRENGGGGSSSPLPSAPLGRARTAAAAVGARDRPTLPARISPLVIDENDIACSSDRASSSSSGAQRLRSMVVGTARAPLGRVPKNALGHVVCRHRSHLLDESTPTETPAAK